MLINKEERDRENEERSKILEMAYKKATELLDDERIDPEKFRGLYSDKIIKKHQDYVDQRREKFKATNTPEEMEMQRYSTVFEAIVHDQIDMNGWLGEHAAARKASCYDDLKNGVDEIIEFEQTEASATAHLALGVDVTFGKGVFSKMNDIKTRIDAGDIGVIKYLLTDTYRGEMKNVPRAVIGVDMKNLNEIIKLWADNKKKSLAQHKVKFIILSQIMMQLNDFAQYAGRTGKGAIANSFNRVLKIVENVWDEESKGYSDKNGDFDFEEDRVYNAIRSYCDDLNKQQPASLA
ncbi:hypothetical protein HY797_04420 [Candidatus Falkowbacteria bacterium]|nr:hypothetical protein [Candidatus Falkowbacteria bacterium]